MVFNKCVVFAIILIPYSSYCPPQKIKHVETFVVSPLTERRTGLNEQLYFPRKFKTADDIYDAIASINRRFIRKCPYSNWYEYHCFYLLDRRVIRFTRSYYDNYNQPLSFLNELHCSLITCKVAKQLDINCLKYEMRAKILMLRLDELCAWLKANQCIHGIGLLELQTYFKEIK